MSTQLLKLTNKEIKMKYLVSLSTFLFLFTATAQEDHTINATGEREVERAYRIVINPMVIDTVIQSPVVDYPLLLIQMETKTELETISPASVNSKEKLAQLYHTYVKLGVGTELMPLGEIYFDSERSRKFIYGAHVKHLSSLGNIKDYAPSTFDRTRFGLYGGINEKRYSLRGDVHYNNQGLHYYAIPNDSIFVADSISQRYSDFGVSGSYSSHIKDSAKLNYTVGMAYNNYLSKKPRAEELTDWRARENYFAITSAGWYKHKSETYAAEVNVRYNGYKYGLEGDTLNALDTGIVLNNTIINLKPTITTRLWNNRFLANVGADIVFDIHNKTKAHIYPIAELKYSMFNDIFIPYAGLRGGLKQTTFKSLTLENEFIIPNVNMRNENTSIDFYGGIKGTLSKRISFNASISFANVKDKALFVSDTTFSLGNKFGVVFDTINVTTVEGAISYQLREKLKIDGIGRYYSYSARNNPYAWNLPQLQFILRGSYNLFDKFIFNVDFDLEQGRRALVYTEEESDSYEDLMYVKKLGIIADANLGVEYRYNKRISAFVQFNNLASQRYMRWYNAPVHAFQVLGGVTFRF